MQSPTSWQTWAWSQPPFDVKLIMSELDITGAGAISREDFMRFIRNGGRRPRPPPPTVTLDRRLSIELDADKVEAAGSTWASSLSVGS